MRQNFHSFLVFAVALLALFGGVQQGPAQELAPVPKLLTYTPPVIPVWQPPAWTPEPLPATTTAGFDRTHDDGLPNRCGYIQAAAGPLRPAAGPPWGPPGWPNSPPDPSPPPKKTCYKTERYCTEWLSDGHCKLWGTRKVEVPC